MKQRTRMQSACGSEESDPHSRFPQGKAGAGTVPPTAQTTHLPPQEGFQSAPLKSPLRDPPAARASHIQSKKYLPESRAARYNVM
jgi:hypothetical protein